MILQPRFMENIRSQFYLDPNITFLNFGSFGATPKPVMEQYHQYQLQMEMDPVEFLTNTGLKLMQASKEALAAYVHCNAEDLVFITNPSYGVNMIAKNLQLQPGDEILTTDIEYGACDKAWKYYCDKAGAKYVQQPVKFPIAGKDEFVDNFFKGLSAKTKMVFISHITSSTGLRLPVEEICAKAKEHGLITFVDGAHAPGQLPLNLATLQADMYTGACHKWMMTPKGSSFIYVKKELQQMLDPLIISWGYQALFPSASTFQDYHQLNGTRDFSAFLCVPAALKFMQENNWEDWSVKCRKLVQDNASVLCEILGTEPLAPVNDDFTLQMFSAEIKTSQPEKLHQRLYDAFRIQVPVMRLREKNFIRYSINAFNSQQDLDRLFGVLKELEYE